MDSSLWIPLPSVDQHDPKPNWPLRRRASRWPRWSSRRSHGATSGTLSAKVRRPASPYSQAKVTDAKQGRQEALAQPHQTLGLIEQAKQGVDQKIQSGQEKLYQRWLQLRQKQPSEGAHRSLLLILRFKVHALEASPSSSGLPPPLWSPTSKGLQGESVPRPEERRRPTGVLHLRYVFPGLVRCRLGPMPGEGRHGSLADGGADGAAGPERPAFTPSGKPQVEEIEME